LVQKGTRNNVLSDLDEFLRSWNDLRCPRNLKFVELKKSHFGNVNSSGEIDYQGFSLSRWHPQFVDSLEKGVRELVLTLVEDFGWITYSSCEGHRYGGTRISPCERMVSLYPRSRDEFRIMIRTLKRVTRKVNTDGGPVRLRVVACNLTDKASGKIHKGVDLIFARAKDWDSYFNRLPKFYLMTLNALGSVSLHHSYEQDKANYDTSSVTNFSSRASCRTRRTVEVIP